LNKEVFLIGNPNKKGEKEIKKEIVVKGSLEE